MSKALAGSASYFETFWGFCCFSFSPQVLLDKNQPLHEKEVQSEDGVGARNSLPILWHYSPLWCRHISLVQHKDPL